MSNCGISIYTDPICRAWLDQYCCPQEQACATNCQQIIACINACPAPPTDACINACTQLVTPEGMAQLDAIANCSKVVPQPPNNKDCAWPK